MVVDHRLPRNPGFHYWGSRCIPHGRYEGYSRLITDAMADVQTRNIHPKDGLLGGGLLGDNGQNRKRRPPWKAICRKSHQRSAKPGQSPAKSPPARYISTATEPGNTCRPRGMSSIRGLERSQVVGCKLPLKMELILHGRTLASGSARVSHSWWQMNGSGPCREGRARPK